MVWGVGAVEGDFKNCAYLWKNPGYATACNILLFSLQFSHYKATTLRADNGKVIENPAFSTMAMFLSNKPGVPPEINLLQKPSRK